MYSSEWKTYMEWQCAGRHVREGCRGVKENGLTLFSRDQTSPAGVHDCYQHASIDLSGDPNQLKLDLPIADEHRRVETTRDFLVAKQFVGFPVNCGWSFQSLPDRDKVCAEGDVP